MLEVLRTRYNSILTPAAKLAVRMRIHPNFITLAGVCMFICSGYLIWRDRWKTAALFLTIGGLMDGLDGAAARHGGSSSLFGSVLDSFCDRLTEIFLFGGITAWYAVSFNGVKTAGAFLALTSLILSLLISYLRARAEGAGLKCRSGLMQRPERLILVGILLLLNQEIMIYGLSLISLLSFITVLQRLGQIRIEAGRRKRSADD